MEKQGFPRDDRLYVDVCRAYDAACSLSTTLDYLSCKSGVGKPPRE
jgi:hypothetical protein